MGKKEETRVEDSRAHYILYHDGESLRALSRARKPSRSFSTSARSNTQPERRYRGTMARSHFTIAFVAAVLTGLMAFSLLYQMAVQSDTTPSWLDVSEKQSVQQDSLPLKKDAVGAYAGADGDVFTIGVGKADITGPVVELNMMGYADLAQTDTGLRQRIFSRAFIVGEPDNAENRFVYLVLDTQSGDTAVRDGILKGVAALGGEYSVYSSANVAVTGTHSHSGPGAWLNYLLPTITSKGFNKQSYQAIVDGGVLSIKRAHESLTTGRLSWGKTRIEDANINRSLFAYLANPESERARYTDDVDKDLTLLKFQRESDGKAIGVLTWFAVHGTSLLGNNTLVAGDNKGVSAYLFEKSAAANDDMADDFVAGFSQANVGDTTPNVLGAWCEDGSDQQCRLEDSTCGNKSQPCHGRGPYYGLNDGGTKSCWEIGNRVFNGAEQLYKKMAGGDGQGTPVVGKVVRAYHSFQDFTNFAFTLVNGSAASTCPGGLGYSFAAGTSDWPGAFDFRQNDPGEPDANPLWRVVSGLLREPSAEQKACQQPKPVLLDVGEISKPYPWAPNIVDVQMFRVGQFFIIVSPGEATTMSGRRWREAIAAEATDSKMTEVDPIVVLGGPANSYTHYIATPEEYGVQRYEGASTLYGPHTLDAYINLTVSYLPYLAEGSTGAPPTGPSPPINVDKALSFITGVVLDTAPSGKKFGDVLTNPNTRYSVGDVVNVTFVGANPRNDLHLEGTYAAVERKTGDSGSWARIRSDFDWDLVFRWARVGGSLAGTSQVTISWETGWSGREADAGTYRIKYYGDSKLPVIGIIRPFVGTSGEFTLS